MLRKEGIIKCQKHMCVGNTHYYSKLKLAFKVGFDFPSGQSKKGINCSYTMHIVHKMKSPQIL